MPWIQIPTTKMFTNQILKDKFNNTYVRAGVPAHTYNPSYFGG
jgi:hypothetical protein